MTELLKVFEVHSKQLRQIEREVGYIVNMLLEFLSGKTHFGSTIRTVHSSMYKRHRAVIREHERMGEYVPSRFVLDFCEKRSNPVFLWIVATR